MRFLYFVVFSIGKTVTAMYVVQLAFADSLFLLSVPIFGMQLATHNWSFGSGMNAQKLKRFMYFCLLCDWLYPK